MDEHRKDEQHQLVRLKGAFISEDGESFLCIRQYYLNDLTTGNLIDGRTLQGRKFRLMPKEIKKEIEDE